MSIFLRHSAPGKLDHAPFGTSCKVINGDNTYDLYKQYSNDEENPKWECMGTFTENALDNTDLHAIINKNKKI